MPKLLSVVRKEFHGSGTIYWLNNAAAKQQAQRSEEQRVQELPRKAAARRALQYAALLAGTDIRSEVKL